MNPETTEKTENISEPAEMENSNTAKSDSPEVPVDPFLELQAERDRLRDLALRTQADFDNYRKRVAREREEAVKFANTGLIERLLPVVDNFELGLDAARKGGDTNAILSGMAMVQRQLSDFLSESGVQPVDAVGAEFDPNLHEAVAHENSDCVEEGRVVRQLRRGYKLRERLLRPATVMISSGPSSADAPAAS